MGSEETYKLKPFAVGYFILGSYRETPCLKHSKPCIAFRADEGRFFGIQDSLQITDNLWRKWKLGESLPKGTICIRTITNRTMKTGLGENVVKEVLDFFSNKEDVRNLYIQEIKRIEELQKPKRKRRYPLMKPQCSK